MDERPFSIKSNVKGPKEGSVTFWLETAPTPARVYEHRAATAGDDEAIATPNIFVFSHLATSENVILELPQLHQFLLTTQDELAHLQLNLLKLDEHL